VHAFAGFTKHAVLADVRRKAERLRKRRGDRGVVDECERQELATGGGTAQALVE
jgi:hypothetical protein